ncbi:MAG: sigma-70 family RNA polymerase sigma factor [candidate division WOR-3 bacterium]|nr:sigma-70 family RNA polymerase sigma factor [candidate division WOR-3 bacterium]MCX7837434.1 sigma-70 family RNA polymerase sigma factor [candidate division WOR-3 bacterium]MDW8114130.1 sigma-70 family RNA polymerase sigma factor [candidate division WOR-3 bacterium]
MAQRISSYYLSLSQKYPDLTKDEERELIKKAKSNNYEAFSKLVLSYLKLVVKIAQRYRSQNLTLDDLICEGITGLMEAIYKFDENKGVRLATYAARRIKYRIREAIFNETLLNFPPKIQKLAKKIRKETSELFLQPEKLAEKLKVQLDEVKEAIDFLNLTRFDLETEGTSEENPIITYDSQNIQLKKIVLKKIINECLSYLSEKERIIIKKAFGLTPYKDSESLTKIGKDLKLSRERVRQIRNEALKKLRRYLIKRLDLLSPFL